MKFNKKQLAEVRHIIGDIFVAYVGAFTVAPHVGMCSEETGDIGIIHTRVSPCIHGALEQMRQWVPRADFEKAIWDSLEDQLDWSLQSAMDDMPPEQDELTAEQTKSIVRRFHQEYLKPTSYILQDKAFNKQFKPWLKKYSGVKI